MDLEEVRLLLYIRFWTTCKPPHTTPPPPPTTTTTTTTTTSTTTILLHDAEIGYQAHVDHECASKCFVLLIMALVCLFVYLLLSPSHSLSSPTPSPPLYLSLPALSRSVCVSLSRALSL